VIILAILVRRDRTPRAGDEVELLLLCHSRSRCGSWALRPSMVTPNPRPSPPITIPATSSYFEPLTRENVLNIGDRIANNSLACLCHFEAQTPLNFATALAAVACRSAATSRKSSRVRKTEALGAMLYKLCIRQTPAVPPSRTTPGMPTRSRTRAVRPSLFSWPGHPARAQRNRPSPLCARRRSSQPRRPTPGNCGESHPRRSRPSFLETRSRWTSIALATAKTVVIGAIMEHIEEPASTAAIAPARFPVHPQGEVKLISPRRQDHCPELTCSVLMTCSSRSRNYVVYCAGGQSRASRTLAICAAKHRCPAAETSGGENPGLA